jgi:hypothetical protein
MHTTCFSPLLAATPQNLKILAASQHSVPEKLSRVGFLGLCIIKY